ncbi:branched-chain amino acid ABC transporter permease [Haladaptatus sp. DYSN1]|uniref:branched-chain amino acid ABC transporter permease n=1 Tax=unclassified Haladaptatus TaxID=2622732 RepID=UPI0024061720|nr:branched-chain amino acid ABC transporter permease [Haladaptatus sp. DYSN1]
MPCGEYFTDYGSRMGLFRWRTQRIALALVLPIPFLLPFVLGGGTVSLLSKIYIFAIAVLGLNVILGYAGEIVLAQGAFMAIGAYSTSRMLGTGAGLLPSMVIGGLVAAGVAVAFGLPAFRVKGFYIAISTLALQFIAEWFFLNDKATFIHGGVQQSIPVDVGLIGGFVSVSSRTDIYFVALVSMLLFAMLSLNLSRTGIGRSFRAVHENDLAAAVLGINVFQNKLLAFAIGGFMIGFSGGLYAIWIGFLDPGFFTIELTLEHYVMLLFGGLGRVWGALLGVAVVSFLLDYLRNFFTAYAGDATALIPVIFGAVIIIVLAVEPKGVLAALGQLKEYLRKWPYAY